MLRLAFDFIITWRETRTRPNAYLLFVVRETKVDNLYCKAMECWQKGRGKNIKKVCCAFARQTFNSL